MTAAIRPTRTARASSRYHNGDNTQTLRITLKLPPPKRTPPLPKLPSPPPLHNSIYSISAQTKASAIATSTAPTKAMS